MRIHQEKLVHGKNERIPIHLENNIINYYLNREVKMNKDQQCERC